MDNMINMTQEDFDAAMNVARQAGREDVLHEIRRISSLMRDDSQQEVLVIYLGAFKNIEKMVTGE